MSRTSATPRSGPTRSGRGVVTTDDRPAPGDAPDLVDPDRDPRATPDADPESVARTICLNQLTVAPRTRAQLAQTLAKRGVPDDVSTRVLDRFTEVGLIDDAAYAAAWVESRQAGRGLARRALAQELRRKGVADDVAAEALDTVTTEDERASAEALVRRKLAATRGLPTETRIRRLSGMLARKGYYAGLAYAVVRDALATEGLDPPDWGSC